jgi:hypothetical protein
VEFFSARITTLLKSETVSTLCIHEVFQVTFIYTRTTIKMTTKFGDRERQHAPDRTIGWCLTCGHQHRFWTGPRNRWGFYDLVGNCPRCGTRNHKFPVTNDDEVEQLRVLGIEVHSDGYPDVVTFPSSPEEAEQRNASLARSTTPPSSSEPPNLFIDPSWAKKIDTVFEKVWNKQDTSAKFVFGQTSQPVAKPRSFAHAKALNEKSGTPPRSLFNQTSHSDEAQKNTVPSATSAPSVFGTPSRPSKILKTPAWANPTPSVSAQSSNKSVWGTLRATAFGAGLSKWDFPPLSPTPIVEDLYEDATDINTAGGGSSDSEMH